MAPSAGPSRLALHNESVQSCATCSGPILQHSRIPCMQLARLCALSPQNSNQTFPELQPTRLQPHFSSAVAWRGHLEVMWVRERQITHSHVAGSLYGQAASVLHAKLLRTYQWSILRLSCCTLWQVACRLHHSCSATVPHTLPAVFNTSWCVILYTGTASISINTCMSKALRAKQAHV